MKTGKPLGGKLIKSPTPTIKLPNNWTVEVDFNIVRVPMPPRGQLTITVFRKDGTLISRTILPYKEEED